MLVTTLVLEGWSSRLAPEHSVLEQVRQHGPSPALFLMVTPRRLFVPFKTVGSIGWRREFALFKHLFSKPVDMTAVTFATQVERLVASDSWQARAKAVAIHASRDFQQGLPPKMEAAGPLM